MGTVALPCPYLIPATRQTPCAAAALPTVAKPGRPCHFPTWSLEVAVGQPLEFHEERQIPIAKAR